MKTQATNKDPLIHFPFYINQYQGLMSGYSFIEKGAFIALLAVYLSEDGNIPEDITKIYRMTGAVDDIEKSSLNSVKDDVIRLGKEIIANQKIIRDKRRKKAKKAAKTRWKIDGNTSNAPSITRAMNEECQSDAITETEKETDIEINKETEKEKKLFLQAQFELFWDRYDKKVSKPDAEKKFKAALKKDTLENIMTGLNNYIKTRSPDSQYWKNPTTWLNQECWKDEYIPKASFNHAQSGQKTNWDKF
jgi:uncharacterized protein YdaU (DUF1376 family)